MVEATAREAKDLTPKSSDTSLAETNVYHRGTRGQAGYVSYSEPMVGAFVP